MKMSGDLEPMSSVKLHRTCVVLLHCEDHLVPLTKSTSQKSGTQSLACLIGVNSQACDVDQVLIEANEDVASEGFTNRVPLKNPGLAQLKFLAHHPLTHRVGEQKILQV